MDGLSGVASVIAVVYIAAKVASLCYQYSVEVKAAKDDIESQLSTTRTLPDSLQRCFQELTELEAASQAKLGPSRRRKAMQRFDFRALKWPITSKEVEKTVQNLEKYGHAFSLALQVDQT